jgi:hypothetical protein
VFMSRWSVAAMQYAAFRQQLIDMGASIEVSNNAMETIITVAYVIVILLGTIGTVYFGRRTINNTRSSL